LCYHHSYGGRPARPSTTGWPPRRRRGLFTPLPRPSAMRPLHDPVPGLATTRRAGYRCRELDHRQRGGAGAAAMGTRVPARHRVAVTGRVTQAAGARTRRRAGSTPGPAPA
jgi:hypothetical protein